MATGTYEWNELSDSREFLEAKTPRFISWFLGIVMVLTAVGIGWSYWYKIDIVVKAQAVVRPNTRISTVSSYVQGKVTEINYQSGQHVHQGEVLLRIGLDNLPKQQEDLQTQLKKTEDDLEVLASLEKQAESSVPAHSWKVRESESGMKWKVSFEQNENDREQAQQLLNDNSKLLNAIRQKQNLFAESEPYYQKYETYRLKIEQLEAAKDEAAKAFKLNLRADAEASSDENNAYANAQRDLDSYRSQYISDLQTAIQDSQTRLRQLELERSSLIAQLKDSIETLKQQKQDLNRQLADLNLQISEHTITAPIDGVVNAVRSLAVGDLVQAGESILNIVPENSSEYVMRLAVANRDIGSVKPGTSVKFDFLALPAKDYGHLTGTITWLSPDALTDTDSGQSYYEGEAALNGKMLTDRRGHSAEVKVGMVAKAYMITDRETVMNWLLKKIYLKD